MDNSTLTWIGNTFLYISLFFTLLLISNFIYRIKYRKINIDHELSVKDNLAFTILTTGYFTGIIIIFCGIIQGDSYGYLNDILLIISYGLLGNLLLVLSSFLNDKILFSKAFNFFKEITRDENDGAGFIEAANFIACSLIIYGAISGKSINYFPNLHDLGFHLSNYLSVIFFWIIGQALLIIGLKIFIKILNYNILNLIEKDNSAAGISLSGITVAIAILYSQAIKGDHFELISTFENIAYFLIFGAILFPISRWIIDKILFPKSSLTHEIACQEIPNQGAGLIEAFAYIASAIVITYCI